MLKKQDFSGSLLPGIWATWLSGCGCSLPIFSCRVFSQCFIGATQYGWNRNFGWLLSTCQWTDWPSLSSLLTMASPPLDTTLTHHLLFITATNHRTDHLRLFLIALCVQDSLNRFCWWPSQTIAKWTRPSVSGVAEGITSQQGSFWAAHVYCAVISSAVSQKVCWDVPIAICFLLLLFSFYFFFLFNPP